MVKNKSRWWLLAMIPPGLLLAFALALTSFNFRITILTFMTKDLLCGTISPNGKWLACTNPWDEIDPSKYVLVYSTDFPFRKTKIYLPEPHLKDTYGTYGVTGGMPLLSWSMEGNTFVIPVYKGESKTEAEICFVHLLGNGQYELNSYFEEGREEGGKFTWSTSSDHLLYADQMEDGTLFITILDNKGRVVDQFTTEVVKKPMPYESYQLGWYIFDEPNIYTQIIYEIVDDSQHRIRPLTGRTELIKISPDKSENVTLLSEQKGIFKIVSIEPNGSRILLMEFLEDINNKKFYLLDLTNNQMQEVQSKPFEMKMFFEERIFCLENCSSTAILMSHQEVKPSGMAKKIFSLFVWSWEKMNFTYYPHKFLLGEGINPIKGFMCSPPKIGILWITTCR